MANYTNKTDITNLEVGDVIVYDRSFSEEPPVYYSPDRIRTIKTGGKFILGIQMEGARNQSSGGKGGIATFTIDTSCLLPYNANGYLRWRAKNPALFFWPDTQPNSNVLEYYRIAVPGDTGFPGHTPGGSTVNGGGGGSQGIGGQAGNGAVSDNCARGNAGKMKAGGTNNGGETALNGGFGYGGADPNFNYNMGGGGYGWYGGGAGSIYQYDGSYWASGGGGSGFVLSNDPNTNTMAYLPSDWNTVLDANASAFIDIANAVTNVQLTRSGSTAGNNNFGKMTITIVDVASSQPTVAVTNIYVAKNPNKTVYNQYESSINTDGMVVNASYSDGTIGALNLNDLTISNFDNTLPEGVDEKYETVYINYTDPVSGNTFTTSLTITVVRLAISSIEVYNYIDVFAVNSAFTTGGHVVANVIMNDGGLWAVYESSQSETSSMTFSTPDMTTTGSKTVTVTVSRVVYSSVPAFTGTTTYNINVVSQPLKYTSLQCNASTFKKPHDYDSNHIVDDNYMFNLSANSWSQYSSKSISAKDIWTDGVNIYYSGTSEDNATYILNKNTASNFDRWESGHYFDSFTGGGSATHFYGEDVWSDGTNIYASRYGTYEYVLNLNSKKVENKTWNGYTHISGQYIWYDGNRVRHGLGLRSGYYLDPATSTWYLANEDGPKDIAAVEDIWGTGTNVYYSSNYDHYRYTGGSWVQLNWNISFSGRNIFIFSGQYYVLATDGSEYHIYKYDDETNNWIQMVSSPTDKNGNTISSPTTLWAFPSLSNITRIRIMHYPIKRQYYVGETFDPTGLSIRAFYDDGTTELIYSGYTLSTPDMTTAGTKTITVTYEGYTASFTITVIEVVLSSISVETMPTKTVYNMGDTFLPTGLTIRKTYSDNSYTVINTGYYLSTPDMSTVGIKTVTVTVIEDDVTCQTTFNITVTTTNSVVQYYDSTQNEFKPCFVYYYIEGNPTASFSGSSWTDEGTDYDYTTTIWDLDGSDEDYDYYGISEEIAFQYMTTVPQNVYSIDWDYDNSADADMDDTYMQYKINNGQWTDETSNGIVIPNDLVNPTISFRWVICINDSHGDVGRSSRCSVTIPKNPLNVSSLSKVQCDVYIYDGTEFKKIGL